MTRRVGMSLAGRWRFALDPGDRGVRGRWFNRRLAGTIRLPGSLQAQGRGLRPSPRTPWMANDAAVWGIHLPRSYRRFARPEHFKTTLWLTPRRHYQGPAWYQREIVIPRAWAGRRLTLSLERCHWTTACWLDGRPLGTNDSLSVPHRYVLTNAARPGKARLTLRVDNRYAMEVGRDAHSVSDHTQTNWNGVIGRMTVEATERIWIEHLSVAPDVRRRAALVTLTLGNATGRAAAVRVTARAALAPPGGSHRLPARMRSGVVGPRGGTIQFRYALGRRARLWDEFSPALYRLNVALAGRQDRGTAFRDTAATVFGLRAFTARGTRFAINGRPAFLRGTLECAVFPRTGYPPTDVPAWTRIFRVCKAHGLNHVRFHSWCPPEAAFAAADTAGMYLQVEAACWATLGDGNPVEGWIMAEADRILRAYGNHPSFVMMAYGNEPGGKRRKAWLGGFVRSLRRRDPRRMYTSGSGWPAIPANHFHVLPDPRIQHWQEGLTSRVHSSPPETTTDYRAFVRRHRVPVVAHEIGQWCAFPNFGEMAKYTGLLRPRNFEAFREILRDQGLSRLARAFLMASGRLQVACYKEEIESALRTKGFGGFQLLDLHDFPGQGTSLVGVLDAFWDAKPYLKPGEFSRFCGPTVVLARLPKRTWTTDEVFSASLEVSNFGPRPLRAAARWRVSDDAGRTLATGTCLTRQVPVANGVPLGAVRVPLAAFAPARRYTFAVSLRGTDVANDWSFWVFPIRRPVPPDRNILETRDLDRVALATLAAGGRVLWSPDPARIETGGAVLGMAPVFWNTCYTNNAPPHTLGLLCDPRHPALAAFPTAFHADWQWWDLLSHGAAFDLGRLPRPPAPIVRAIDTWYENRNLGLVFETRVGRGRLLASGLDVATDLDHRPAALQLRASLLAHLRSPLPIRAAAITPARLQALVRDVSPR